MRVFLALVFLAASTLSTAAPPRNLAQLPAGTELELRRELTVPNGHDYLIIGENYLQSSFNRAFQFNNQQLGRPLVNSSWRTGRMRFNGDPLRYGESVEKSYADCKARYREYYWQPRASHSRTLIKTPGRVVDITREKQRSGFDWTFSRQGEHPCVKPKYSYAALMVNADKAGGTFRRGHTFRVTDVSHYRRGEGTVIDIELDSDVLPSLRIVSSEAVSSLRVSQLDGSRQGSFLGLLQVGGNLFNLRLPGKRYYE